MRSPRPHHSGQKWTQLVSAAVRPHPRPFLVESGADSISQLQGGAGRSPWPRFGPWPGNGCGPHGPMSVSPGSLPDALSSGVAGPRGWSCRRPPGWSPLGEGLSEDRLSPREAPGTALERTTPQLLRLPRHVWTTWANTFPLVRVCVGGVSLSHKCRGMTQALSEPSRGSWSSPHVLSFEFHSKNFLSSLN